MTLIQRLEQLTGPDREVDADIYRLLRGDKRPQAFWYFSGLRQKGDNQDEAWIEWSKEKSPRYTSSIDAAAFLILDSDDHFERGNRAGVIHAALWQLRIGDIPAWRIPIVITIAALKARGVK